MSRHQYDFLPESVRAELPRSVPVAEVRPVLQDIPPPARIPVILVLVILLLVVGHVIYIVISQNQISRLNQQIEKLSAPNQVAVQAPRLSIDAVMQRQLAPAVSPQPSRPQKPVIAVRPDWASELKQRWLQFQTPYDDAEFRLPPSGGHHGLAEAEVNGYTVECVFGETNTQPARAAIKLDFKTNVETNEQYALGRVASPAFRGRDCVLEWMAK